MFGERCKKCGRLEWSPIYGSLDGSHCASTDNAECRVIVQRDALLAALRSILPVVPLGPARRTAFAVLEQVQMMQWPCPVCGYSLAVSRGVVREHYARTGDTMLCPASFRRYEGGELK